MGWAPNPGQTNASCGGGCGISTATTGTIIIPAAEPEPLVRSDTELKYLCDLQEDGTYVPFCMRMTFTFDDAGAIAATESTAINYDGTEYTVTGIPGPCPVTEACDNAPPGGGLTGDPTTLRD